MESIMDTLVETDERVSAVGDEHASEEKPIDIADSGVAHIVELLLGLDPEIAQELFDFARAAAASENHPATNFLRGFLVGAVWQREFGVDG